MNVLRTRPAPTSRTKYVWLFTSATLVAGALLASGPDWVTCSPLTPAEAAAQIARVRPLHLGILVGCAVMTLVAMGALLYSIGAFGNGREGIRPDGSRRWREVAWAFIPLLILVAAAAPPVRALVTPEAGTAQSAPTAGYRCQFGDSSAS